MDTSSCHFSDLSPDQRDAAEKLIGRPLANFEKGVVRVLDEGSDIVIRISEVPRNGPNQPPAGKWDVPPCFNVLTDLTDDERRALDAVIAEPVRLSNPD